eukprot:scaffold274466_cov33-Tisochrysis_lutea.AAC.3
MAHRVAFLFASTQVPAAHACFPVGGVVKSLTARLAISCPRAYRSENDGSRLAPFSNIVQRSRRLGNPHHTASNPTPTPTHCKHSSCLRAIDAALLYIAFTPLWLLVHPDWPMK